MNQHEALEKLEELSTAMEEDRIEISRLSTWDIDFLKNMSLSYEDYKSGDLELSPKQITQIDRIYDEHIGD
jgi:hypothetical protein